MQDLIDMMTVIPEGAHILLPDRVDVEYPGEPLGQIYKTPKGFLDYRSFKP